MTILPNPQVVREYVAIWSDFLDTLASEGGHIILWMSGVVVGITCFELGYDILGDRIVASAMTGLGIALKTTASNAKRKQEMATTTVTDAETVRTVPPLKENQ